MPVYLPSWLPRFPKRVYPFFSAANPGGMATYDVELSIDAQAPCNACDAFYVSGAQGDISISPYTHPVSLGKGKWAYHVLVHGSMGEEFRWYIGENGYAIRCNCTDAQYVRIVDSMVPAR